MRKSAASSLTVYCASAIASYALFEGADGQHYWAQGYDTVGLFRVFFDVGSPSDWRVTAVHRLEGADEELYPGAGLGTDGFPGLSDRLAAEIPDWGLDTYHIAQRYLEVNDISAEIVTW